jgi:putative ABC transport system substrate-binding protein
MKRRAFIFLIAGATAAWPPAASAQQAGKVFRVGFLNAGAPIAEITGLGDALRELGWIEGKNIIWERRYAEDRLDRLPELAAELARLKVDLIMASGTLAPLAAKRATATIPIVMTAAGDPVGSGLVSSLARPGGNVTGISLMVPELGRKRLELLKDLLPVYRASPRCGMRTIPIPRRFSGRGSARPRPWGSRFSRWRLEGRMTSAAPSKLRSGNCRTL